MKNNRYKGKKVDTLGINSDFMKTLIKANTWHGELKLPKPQNNAEIAMLSKFLFGIELSVRFEYCYDKITEIIEKSKYDRYQTDENLRLVRFLKLYRIDPNRKDYINKGDKKMELIHLQYFCNQEHNFYYDVEFNMKVFNSSYELDSYFWRHCIGELRCGGIASTSYGQVSSYSFKEYERLLNIFKNTDEPVRNEFKVKLDKLIIKDKKYEEFLEKDALKKLNCSTNEGLKIIENLKNTGLTVDQLMILKNYLTKN